MNTVKSFVRQFIAIVKGDDSAVAAQKAFRQANAKLTSQIAQLDGETPNLEDAVDTAKDTLAVARVNGGKTIDNYYIPNLLSAKNNVTSAEEALEKHKEKIAFLQGEKDALNADVEAES